MSDTYIRVDSPGHEIRARRVLLGLSLREAAAQLGCSFQWLSRIERGESLPDIPLAARLRTVLGVEAGLDDWERAVDQAGRQLPQDLVESAEPAATAAGEGRKAS